MRKIVQLLFVFSIPLVVLLLSNCRKEQFGNGKISFSTDTLTFDTVFTSLGSTTKYFKIFNTDKKAVKISSIDLMHLNNSHEFRINVDGVSGDHFTEVEIPAKDSIYVFVEVTVNPTSAATPFVIIDDVSLIINGHNSAVHLQAFGQNAHFHYGEELKNDTTVYWSNDLPHVIISHGDVPGVLVDCGSTLNIQPGAKVFFAGNSAIFVEGTLNAISHNWSDSIIFRGVRLEQFYDDKPGQWFGIVFLRTNDCNSQGHFDHCVVNESTYGIYVGAGLDTMGPLYFGPSHRPDVYIENTIVKNSSLNAIYGFNGHILAENSIFYACGENLIKLGLGGDYTFKQCTMFNTGSRYVEHKNEVLLLSNFVSAGIIYQEPLATVFTNCVLYGSLQNEISFNNANEPITDLSGFDNRFSYCDIKTKQDTFEMLTTNHDNILYNQDPRFRNSDEGNFMPWDSTDANYKSPLIDTAPTGLSTDIYGTSRPQGPKWDIGAVEAP